VEQAVRTETRRAGVVEVDDPFRYGRRYVRRTQPDGTTVIDEIPLTRNDLLYPEEGDFVVQELWHTQDFTYCYSAFATWFAAQSHVVVLGDCRVDWGVPGIRPLGPDIVVLYEVPHWHRQATFHLVDEGGTPVLVVEIASPGMRDNDLGIKRAFYYQAGVQKYIIVDRGPEGEDPVQLIGYQRGPTDWLPLLPDTQGRLELTPVRPSQVVSGSLICSGRPSKRGVQGAREPRVRCPRHEPSTRPPVGLVSLTGPRLQCPRNFSRVNTTLCRPDHSSLCDQYWECLTNPADVVGERMQHNSPTTSILAIPPS
jgi:Uma2 family endonuclease